MSNELLLACTCGAVRGVARDVTPASVNHIVCYCDDCQVFAHAIDRAADILDAHGGSDIVQMSPAKVEITHGIDNLVCLRLRPSGLVRWYTSCCRTPLGNTMASSRPPFIGLIRPVFGPSADAVAGPVVARVQGRFAKGDTSKLDASGFPFRLIARSVRRMAGWWWRDGGRSPLRDATGAPRVTPRVLTAEELRDLRARAGF